MLHNGAALLTFNTLHRFCSVICRPRDGAADNGAARILHEFLGLPLHIRQCKTMVLF